MFRLEDTLEIYSDLFFYWNGKRLKVKWFAEGHRKGWWQRKNCSSFPTSCLSLSPPLPPNTCPRQVASGPLNLPGSSYNAVIKKIYLFSLFFKGEHTPGKPWGILVRVTWEEFMLGFGYSPDGLRKWGIVWNWTQSGSRDNLMIRHLNFYPGGKKIK